MTRCAKDKTKLILSTEEVGNVVVDEYHFDSEGRFTIDQLAIKY